MHIYHRYKKGKNYNFLSELCVPFSSEQQSRSETKAFVHGILTMAHDDTSLLLVGYYAAKSNEYVFDQIGQDVV